MKYSKDLAGKEEFSAAVNDDDFRPRISIEDFSAADLSSVLQNSLCGMALVHSNGRIRWCSEVWESYKGLSEETRLGVFLSQSLCYSDRRPVFKEGYIEEKRLSSATPSTSIVKIKGDPAKQVFMMRLFGPMGTEKDLFMVQMLNISSITSLKRNKATLQTILNGSAEPIFVLDKGGNIISANTHATHLLNAELEQLLRQNCERFFPINHSRGGMSSIRAEIDQHGWWEGTLRLFDLNEKEIIERASVYRVGVKKNGIRYVVIVRSQPDEHPSSTGGEASRGLRKLRIPQRKDMELKIDLAMDSGRRFGLLYTCLNQSDRELTRTAPGKPALIKQVLENLKSKLPTDAFVSAISGSELAAMVPASDAASLEKMARKIRDDIRSGDFKFPSETLFLNVQIGIVMSGNIYHNAEEYLLAGRAAAESAREANLHNIKVVDPLVARRQKGIEGLGGKLKSALQNNEFFPVYEPFIDLKTMKIVGCEALVRWNSPEEGILRPAQFLPAIEAHGLMEELTESLFFRACRDFGQWQGEGYDIQTLSLNVTARDVDPEFLPSLVNRALHHSKLKDNFLQIEITEEGLVDHDKAIAVINALRERGVRVAIDDFGTGYSNLAYLKSLPVDALKIDRAFIFESTRDAGSRALIESINFLGKKLGLLTIAEGIESGEQRDLMSVVGCDLGQGYLFSPPKPARRFKEQLSKG